MLESQEEQTFGGMNACTENALWVDLTAVRMLDTAVLGKRLAWFPGPQSLPSFSPSPPYMSRSFSDSVNIC